MNRSNRQKDLKSFLLGARRDMPSNGPIQRIYWENWRAFPYLVGNWELKSMGLVTKGEGKGVLGG